MTDPKPTKAPKTQPAQPAPTPDEHQGRGGMYTVQNGKRVLLGRTLAEHEAEAAGTTQPAAPVNPATTE